MSTDGVERPGDRLGQVRRRESLAEQIRRKGIQPIADVADQAREGIWESDEELDAFLSHVRAARQAENV